MVQIATLGIEPGELVLLLDVFFILAVLTAAATSGNWNLFEHGWNIINFFFNGADLNNPQCANLFSGFPTSTTSTSTNGNFLTDLISSAVNFMKLIFGFLVGIIVFLWNAIVGCGISLVRLTIGWSIILSLVWQLFQIRSMTNRP